MEKFLKLRLIPNSYVYLNFKDVRVFKLFMHNMHLVVFFNMYVRFRHLIIRDLDNF